jgi:hypothetical protein
MMATLRLMILPKRREVAIAATGALRSGAARMSSLV